MNRLFLIMGLLLIFIMPPAWGAVSRYPDPHRQTMWNDFTDGLHTWGQTPSQAALTKNRLHNARTRARIMSINQAKSQAWIQSRNM